MALLETAPYSISHNCSICIVQIGLSLFHQIHMLVFKLCLDDFMILKIVG